MNNLIECFYDDYNPFYVKNYLTPQENGGFVVNFTSDKREAYITKSSGDSDMITDFLKKGTFFGKVLRVKLLTKDT